MRASFFESIIEDIFGDPFEDLSNLLKHRKNVIHDKATSFFNSMERHFERILREFLGNF